MSNIFEILKIYFQKLKDFYLTVKLFNLKKTTKKQKRTNIHYNNQILFYVFIFVGKIYKLRKSKFEEISANVHKE